MRTNFVFILVLVTLSCVFASNLKQQMNLNSELKNKVEQVKSQSDIGSVIMNMAELESEGKFAPLFDAIKNLVKFLDLQRINEDKSYAAATAQFRIDVTKIKKAKAHAKYKWNVYSNRLNHFLFPQKKSLINIIKHLRQQLSSLQANLKELNAKRLQEIEIYKKKKLDYIQSIAALGKALTLLNSLKSGQSFAEIDANIFAQVQVELSQSLKKLEYGQLYTSFIENMMKQLNSKDFVDQGALMKVYDLIVSIKDRLSKGLITLNQDEAMNKKNYIASRNNFQESINKTTSSIAININRLKNTIKLIIKVQGLRAAQIVLYKKAIAQLIEVKKNFEHRTAQHNKLIEEINEEQHTIKIAVDVLNKAGITASA